MTHPFIVDIDPVAFHVFAFGVRWYGLMYLGGFLGGLALGEYRRRRGRLAVDRDAFLDLAFYVMLGVIIGGRIWYMLTYQPISWVWKNPLQLFQVWDGGMSFHGGLLGVLVASLWWWWRHRATVTHYFDVVDFVAPLVPIGLGLGRLGNFINGELWGKPSHLPWAMIFPYAQAEDRAYVFGSTIAGNKLHFPAHPAWQTVYQQLGGHLPRQPSELYEFALEGIVLFTVLWLFSSKPRHRYAVSGLFALLYGIFRFAAEFVRLPDPQLGYLFHTGWLTMGQVQSIPLVIVGLLLLCMSRRAPVAMPQPVPVTATSRA
jgi:phosphatidylglycerol---prolipoprotein diacylglyceryl transferase